jgi:hypothetical protein
MTVQERFDKETDWRKKALIIEFFHSLMMIRHKDKWSVKKTSSAVKKSMGLVSENINIARAIKSGILEKCDSRNHALKIIRGQDGISHNKRRNTISN